ncbi:MAG: hypothetical protein Q9191_008037, partial [Dirinaria sp. TL-2023a]
MVEQTRNGQSKRLRPWGWQDNVVALAAVCWWMSLLAQLGWHALSVIKWTDEPAGLRAQDFPSDSSVPLPECVRRSLVPGPLEPACAQSYSTLTAQALYLGLLSAWWNPRLRQKLRGNVGRMVGLVEYYKLQVVFLLLRAAAWGLLAHSSAFGSDTKHARATHSFMVAFITISIVLSYNTVQWDPTPRVSFRSNLEPLLPPETSQSRAEQQRNEPTQLAAQAQ